MQNTNSTPKPLLDQIVKGLVIGAGIAALGLTGVVFGPKLFVLAKSTQAPQQAAVAPPPQAPQQAPISAQPSPPAAVPSPPPTPSAQVGMADIQDTATLFVNGQRIALWGVEPVSRNEAVMAAKSFLNQAGEIRCEIVPFQTEWACHTKGKNLDVAEVLVLSGFAKAKQDAPQHLKEAQSQAKQNKRGIWGG